MTNKYVLIMALVYSGAAGASTSLALWMPQLVKSFGLTNWQTGLVNAVPFGIAAVWMILWGRSSDRSGERVWHNALPLAWMVLAMVATFFAIHSLWAMIPLLTLIAAGTYASKGPFWALASEWLGAASAAAGLAQINALGNLSGFVFNYLIGWIQEETAQLPAGPDADRRGGDNRHHRRSGDRSSPAAYRGGDNLRSGFGQAIHPRRGAAVERLLVGRRRAGGDPLEGVPQLGVAAGLLVRREVALEHAAVGAERLDARLDVLAPRRGEFLGRRRRVALVEVEAERGHADAAELDVDVRAFRQFADVLPPAGEDLLAAAGIGTDAEHAADMVEDDRRVREGACEIDRIRIVADDTARIRS